jgi:hypothetical protein
VDSEVRDFKTGSLVRHVADDELLVYLRLVLGANNEPVSCLVARVSDGLVSQVPVADLVVFGAKIRGFE